MDRMDIYHKFFQVARRNLLHNVRFTENPNPNEGPRILDLGCGTGIWAIDMAEYAKTVLEIRGMADRRAKANLPRRKYFQDRAYVQGLDLSLIQPPE